MGSGMSSQTPTGRNEVPHVSQQQQQQQGEEQQCTTLGHLPYAILAALYQNLKPRTRATLAATCKGHRDVVLRDSQSIQLTVAHTDDRQAILRFLQRARQQGAVRKLAISPVVPPRLADRPWYVDNNSRAVEDVLRTFTQDGGWYSIRELYIKQLGRQTAPVAEMGTAFPDLRSLHLEGCCLSRGDLQHLVHLTRLSLSCCRLTDHPSKAKVDPNRGFLEGLPSLREVRLVCTSTDVLNGATQVTSLHVQSSFEVIESVMPVLATLTQLEHLGLMVGDPGVMEPQVLEQLLTTHTLLTSLHLGYDIDQEGCGVLLQHAKQLTRLEVAHLSLTQDMSQAPCSWEVLTVVRGELRPRSLAALPLATVRRLTWGGLTLPSPTLPLEYIHCEGDPCSDTPQLASQAAANLQRCPAWEEGSQPPCLNMTWRDRTPTGHASPEQFGEAIAALSSLPSEQVQVVVDAAGLPMGPPYISQLSQALGPRLTRLSLRQCDLADGFWAAALTTLPGLQGLVLRDGMRRQVTEEDVRAAATSSPGAPQLWLGRMLARRLAPEAASMARQVCEDEDDEEFWDAGDQEWDWERRSWRWGLLRGLATQQLPASQPQALPGTQEGEQPPP